jgi:hypothetical protein
VPAGRPKGSRNAVSRPHAINVRLTEDERGWLLSYAESLGISESEAVRAMISATRLMLEKGLRR